MNQLLQWKNQILLRARALTAKRIVTLLLCAVLLFLPTFGALIYRHYADNTSIAEVFSVTLYDEDGKKFGYDTGTPNAAPRDSLLWIFYHISKEMQELRSAPGDPDKDLSVRALTDLNGKEQELRCYFSTIASSSYCIDEDGTVYSIPTVYSESFLCSPYAELFYSHAKAPALITIDKDTVLPAEVNWYYKNYGDAILPAQRNPLDQSVPLYELTGVIGLSFTTPPDRAQAQIYNGDELFYSGPMDQLSSLTPDTGNEMTLSLHAVWDRETHPDAYGEQRYQFSIKIRNRSEFSIGNATIPVGGFTTLSGTNITNLSKIVYDSDIDGFTPTFRMDGEQARALMVVPENTPVGSYSITLTYGASTQTFLIEAVPKEQPRSFLYPEIPLADPLSVLPSALNDWQELLRDLPSPGTMDYFQGNFSDPTEDGFEIGYTHQSSVRWKHDVVESVLGQEFVTTSSEVVAVGAVQSGEVIETGSCSLLGNYVVLDHGRGLRIWYGHLSDIDVEKGDILRQGQSIGKTGNTGAATGNGFLILCTVYREVIDPSLILGKELE